MEANMAKTKFAPNPPPKIDNRSIPKGYTYIPGQTVNSDKKKKSKIDDDSNWDRLPNQPKGRRF